jgi:tetratricopeptide (TPR) repeat protein
MAEVIEPVIAQHGGRIVKTTGDGFLAEFQSAVAAVRCAVQFQVGVPHVTVSDPPERRVRVGIHIGDVIVEERDIYGDGVNIAARLEGLADPGDPDEAILDFERALRLSPRDVEMVSWQAGIARAHFNAARYDEAMTWSERAISNRSDTTVARRIKAAAHAQAGRMEEARRRGRAARVRPAVAFGPEAFVRRNVARPDDFNRWVQGLRRAGIPD